VRELEQLLGLFVAHLAEQQLEAREGDSALSAHNDLHRGALQAAREAVLAMRANDAIGDDAFREVEEELDWLEMAGGGPSS